MSDLVIAVQPALPVLPQFDVDRLTDAFLRGRNPHTLDAYRRDLEDFRGFLGASTIDAAGRALIETSHGQANATVLAYRAHMLERGLQAATVNRRLAALRSLVKLANVVGLIPWNLTVEGMKATPYRDTRGPGLAAYRALLAAALIQPVSKAARDTTMLRMLHDMGLRRGELVGLDLADVDMPGSRVMILGKARTQREPVTMPPACREALTAWLAIRGDEPGPVFTSFDRSAKGSGRLTGNAVWRIVGTLGRVDGNKVRPHGLRHLAITAALDARVDIRKVQRFSRHKDVRVLTVYDDNREDLGGEVATLISSLV